MIRRGTSRLGYMIAKLLTIWGGAVSLDVIELILSGRGGCVWDGGWEGVTPTIDDGTGS